MWHTSHLQSHINVTRGHVALTTPSNTLSHIGEITKMSFSHVVYNGGREKMLST